MVLESVEFIFSRHFYKAFTIGANISQAETRKDEVKNENEMIMKIAKVSITSNWEVEFVYI